MMFPGSSNLSIAVEKHYPATLSKARFPLRHGTCSEIRTSGYEFVFNLNGEIKFIRGLDVTWPHPAEQLKRTDGNDWVYYTVGDISGENGIISWMGEYYLPCLPYPSNAVWDVNYFQNATIMGAFAEWSQLYGNLYALQNTGTNSRSKELVSRILQNHDGVLFERSENLHKIIGGHVSVLPPDTRHVDYEIIPVMIADGCLYHCDFCCVKSDRKFHVRDRSDILEQIQGLCRHYGRNLENYQALFLGNHDALAAGEDAIHFAALEAFQAFGWKARNITPFQFLFGSVDSLLKSGAGLFQTLDQLPFHTTINIRFESTDPSTLRYIRKPVDASQVHAAFQKMCDINAHYRRVEITGNFLLGETLSSGHDESLARLLESTPAVPPGKGTIYLSPLKDSPNKRELLPRFYAIRHRSQLPVYVYLIQRL